MSRPEPQFRALLKFHFREHGEGRRNWFLFGEDCHRRVPMKIEGIESMHTLGMWREGSRRFEAGDETEVDCVSICPEAIDSVVAPGVTFELWDSGFFAEGRIIERYEGGWPSSTDSEQGVDRKPDHVPS